ELAVRRKGHRVHRIVMPAEEIGCRGHDDVPQLHCPILAAGDQALPVRPESDLVHRTLVSPESGNRLPNHPRSRGSLPSDQGRDPGTGPVTTKWFMRGPDLARGHRPASRVTLVPPPGDLPKAESAVAPPGGQQLAIGGERDGVHPTVVPREEGNLGLRG